MHERLAIDGWPTWIRWVLGCTGLAMFAFCASANAWIVFLGVTSRKAPSIYPLIGGVAGFHGLLLLPVEGAASLRYWPLVLDYGTLAAIIWIPPLMALYVVHEFWAEVRRVFERVPDDDSPKPLQFYGQRIERDSENGSDGPPES